MNPQLAITLPAMRFYAYHGALPQERKVGGDYEVRLSCVVGGAERAVFADELAATVNYAELFALVSEVMATPVALLEHVGGNLLRRIFSRWHQVESAEVEIRKLAPPIVGQCGPATVRLSAVNPWPRSLRLLVLDFDGTVADTSAGIIATMAATFQRLGLPQASDEAVRRTIGLPLRKGIAQLVGQCDDTFIDRAVDVYHELFEEIGVRGVSLFPQVAETLAVLSAQGVRIGIATSRGHRSVVQLCIDLDIDDYINAYVGVEDVKSAKPAPDAVALLLQTLHVRSSEALVVGDTSFDITMGRTAGCATCGVSYGNHSPEQLWETGADAVIDSFSDICGFCRN